MPPPPTPPAWIAPGAHPCSCPVLSQPRLGVLLWLTPGQPSLHNFVILFIKQ